MIKVIATFVFLTTALFVDLVLAAEESRINTDPNFNPDPTLFKVLYLWLSLQEAWGT